MKPLEIKEGDSKVISNKYIDASNFYKKISPGLSHADFELTFQLVNAPLHGELMMSGRPMKDGYDFTQEDLNKGRIKYIHDHSDTTSDRIEIETSLMDLRRENAPNLIDAKARFQIGSRFRTDSKSKMDGHGQRFMG